MPMNTLFDPFSNDPNFTVPNSTGDTNPAVLVDKMIGTAYDVVKHVCRYMEQVRHVSAHMEQVFRVSGDLENLTAISEQLENLEIIATNIDELLALAGPQAALDARVDVLEQNYLTRADTDQTVLGDKRFSGYTSLGPATGGFLPFQIKFLELTGPATGATTIINAGLSAAERGRVVGLVSMVRTAAGDVFMANDDTLTLGLAVAGAGTNLVVTLDTGHPTGWNTAAMSVGIIMKAP